MLKRFIQASALEKQNLQNQLLAETQNNSLSLRSVQETIVKMREHIDAHRTVRSHLYCPVHVWGILMYMCPSLCYISDGSGDGFEASESGIAHSGVL